MGPKCPCLPSCLLGGGAGGGADMIMDRVSVPHCTPRGNKRHSPATPVTSILVAFQSVHPLLTNIQLPPRCRDSPLQVSADNLLAVLHC